MRETIVRPFRGKSEHVGGDMRRRILEGLWRPDQMLPSRRALATEYGVALATMERVVAALISDGLLRADDRRGTFVASSTRLGKTVASSAARAPQAPLTATVAVVAAVAQDLPGSDADWSLHILRACEDHLGSIPGMTMRFVDAVTQGRRPRSPSDILEDIRQSEPDGILLIDSLHRVGGALRAALPAVPVVNVLFDPEDGVSHQVTVDERHGGMRAAEHLLSQGYRPLLFFRPSFANWVENRFAGVRTAAARCGVTGVSLDLLPAEPLPELERDYAQQQEIAYEAARELLEGGLATGTGVIAPNDATAAGFMRAASERGMVAGSDYGIIGFDDYERSADLSTMRPPLERMGAEGALMLERVLRGDAGSSCVMVHHRLIPRGSTRRREEASAAEAGESDGEHGVCSRVG